MYVHVLWQLGKGLHKLYTRAGVLIKCLLKQLRELLLMQLITTKCGCLHSLDTYMCSKIKTMLRLFDL